MTKSLSKAIALATLVGVSASAHAINVNQDGLGEVLLYSLYTSEEGNVTNINITNTTDFTKAVKVRFVEGQNSREVLDFNLYLSPRDQWSGAVTQTDDGAKLITADNSCTAPAIPASGVPFRSFGYTGDNNDDGVQSLARTRVGHIEVIEMGVVDPEYTLPNGDYLVNYIESNHSLSGAAGTKPGNCEGVRAQFKTGIWSGTNYLTGFMGAGAVFEEDANGGLYGSASVLNIENSTQIAYDALALDNFLDDGVDGPKANHTTTGSLTPSLNQGGNKVATFKNGQSAIYSTSADAISALLMKESISNDYVLDEGRGSETNWVVTFPTKRYHVDSGATLAPFTNAWAGTKPNAKSCHTVVVRNWDNEEYEGTSTDIDFSPLPPSGAGEALCYETNILTFNQAKMLGGEFVSYNVNLPQPDFQFGWMNIAFSDTAYSLTSETDSEFSTVNTNGLPVIGFSAVTVKNNEAANGVMNNYGSSTSHKAKTTLDHNAL